MLLICQVDLVIGQHRPIVGLVVASEFLIRVECSFSSSLGFCVCVFAHGITVHLWVCVCVFTHGISSECRLASAGLVFESVREGERPQLLAPVQTKVDATRLSLISNSFLEARVPFSDAGGGERGRSFTRSTWELEGPDWPSQALPMLFKAATHLQG